MDVCAPQQEGAEKPSSAMASPLPSLGGQEPRSLWRSCRAFNWGLAFLSLAVIAAAIFAFSAHRLPISAYFWDDLIFEGSFYAMDHGHLPVRDFWAPLIFPLYLGWLANKLNPGGWYFVLCLLQGLLALALSWPALRARFSSKFRHWVLLFIFLLATLPFNTSTTTGFPEYMNFIYYPGFYNRFSMTLIGVILLMAVPPRPDKEGTLEWLMAPLMLWLLFLTKISAFYVGLIFFAAVIVLRFASFMRFRGWLWLALALAPALVLHDFLALYLEQLRVLAANKLGVLQQELVEWRWRQFHHRSAIEMAAVGVALVAAVAGFVGERKKWRYLLLVGFCFSAIAAIGLFTMTSYGDLGIVPAAFPLLTLAANSQGAARKWLHFSAAVIVWSYFASLESVRKV